MRLASSRIVLLGSCRGDGPSRRCVLRPSRGSWTLWSALYDALQMTQAASKRSQTIRLLKRFLKEAYRHIGMANDRANHRARNLAFAGQSRSLNASEHSSLSFERRLKGSPMPKTARRLSGMQSWRSIRGGRRTAQEPISRHRLAGRQVEIGQLFPRLACWTTSHVGSCRGEFYRWRDRGRAQSARLRAEYPISQALMDFAACCHTRL